MPFYHTLTDPNLCVAAFFYQYSGRAGGPQVRGAVAPGPGACEARPPCPAPAAGVEMVLVLLVCASAASPLAAQPHISIRDAPLCATEAGAAFATSSCRQ